CMGRIGGVDKLEKFDEFATAVAIPDKGMNLTGQQIDAGQQTYGTVALIVTAQVGWMVHERRSDFAKFAGSRVRDSMMLQRCCLAVEKKERMSSNVIAPSKDRKPPEIFCRSFIMRPSRSA